jgi:serine/threonine protein phosphatase PrpC
VLRVAEQYASTDTGLQRRANEDALLARSPLFVVADGMGGAQAGEVASKIAVDAFEDGLGDTSAPEQSLASRALAANARIHELSHSNDEHAGMGTTLTAVYVAAQEIAIAHVGDSRAYCLRDGELIRLTSDHSLVDELVRQGKITPQQAVDHPQRSVITRALGPEPAVEIDTCSYRARAGDVYLLCSDGLTTMLSEERVAEILRAHTRLRDAGEALIAAANEAGGRDNVTVVLFRLEDPTVGAGPLGRAGSNTVSHPSAPQNETDSHASDRATDAGDPAATGQRPGRGAAAYDDTALRANGSSASAAHGAASAATVATGPEPVRRLRPRSPATAAATRAARRRTRLRRLRVALVTLIVLGLIASGAYLALQSIYFIGTNPRGFVTIYEGVPYQLPGGLKLYSSYYVSGVSAAAVAPSRRHTLLDNSLLSEHKAAELVRSLELGQLNE